VRRVINKKFWKELAGSGELPMRAVVARQQPMSLTTPSDAELLRLMAAGEEMAFVTLYQKHQGPVYRFALLMSGAANVAEEVTQEVFLAMIRQPHRYDPARASLSAYLYGMARNQVLRVLKRDRNLVQLADDADEGPKSASFIAPDDPFGACNRGEVVRLVRQAVLSLPPRYREVVVLCHFQELSCAEAAVALDCKVGTVNSRLHRAHSLLVSKLKRHARGVAADAELRCFA
jgi:RNA polymerase sigma-70 factor, ECF subfamily